MGKKRYVIEDNIVRLEEVENLENGQTLITHGGTVHLSDFVNHLAERANHRIFIPRLKVGCVIAQAKTGLSEIYIIEQKPTILTITETTDDREKEQQRKIAVPYVYFVILFTEGSFTELRIFFNKGQVKDPDQILGKCPLPNQDTSGVCTGTGLSNELEGITDLAEICDTVTQHFWRSCFNYDIHQSWEEAKTRIPGFPQSFAEWATMTADPVKKNRILILDWVASGYSINSLLSEVMPGGSNG